jgi:NAD(P)H-hydrate epimerase
VRVNAVCDSENLTGDAATNYFIVMESLKEQVLGPACKMSESRSPFSNELFDGLRQPCWIVDALFGTGLTRPLSTPHSELVAQVNATGNPVLAVDIPSGLDCDTGEPLGPTIRATHTATFVAHKKGFLNPKSLEWTGEVHVIDIGAPRKLIDVYRARRTA